jgi:hypothetical protein
MRQVLHLILIEFQWFEPVRYGDANMKYFIPPDGFDLDPLLAYYEKKNGRHLFVGARTDRDFICFFPATPDVPPMWATVPGRLLSRIPLDQPGVSATASR